MLGGCWPASANSFLKCKIKKKNTVTLYFSYLHLKKGQNHGFVYFSLHYSWIRQRKMITRNCHRQLKRILCLVTNWLCTNESQHCINTRLLDSWSLHLQLEWLSLEGNCFTGNGVVPECMAIKVAPGLYFSKMFIKSVGGKAGGCCLCGTIFNGPKSLNTFFNVAGLQEISSSDWSVSWGMWIEPLIKEEKGERAPDCFRSEPQLLAYVQN